jgi:hypothetical protein
MKRNCESPGRRTIQRNAAQAKFFWATAVVVGVLSSQGCNPADRIEHRVMTYEQTGIPDQVRLPPASSVGDTAVRSRMVTAIAALPTATWFFKAVGPVEDLEASFESFREFLQAIRFDENGQPQYSAPAGWQEAPLRPGRFQTFVFGPAERKTIELAISELGPNQDLPSNVNRWRGQLELPPLDDGAASGSLDKLTYQGGEYLVFDEVGMYRGGMAPAAAPPAGPAHSVTSEASSAAASASGGAENNEAASEPARSLPIEFTIPPNWEQLPKPMFATVKLEQKSGDRKAAISVSEMNPELNTWESAVGSWLAELELASQDAAQVEPFVSEIAIDGQTGKQIRLLLPDAAKGIFAARVEREGRAWFVKLSGDKSLVEESTGDWETFVRSLRFKK